MNKYTVIDEHGDEFTHEASDIPMALVVHRQLHGTEATSVTRAGYVVRHEGDSMLHPKR